MLHHQTLRPATAAQIITALLCLLCLFSPVSAQMKDRSIRLAPGGPNGSVMDGRGKLWAVVIGVSQYRNLGPQQQLGYAHRDAEAFASFLTTPTGGGFPASQLKLLLNQDATLAAVRAELGTILARSAQAEDVVMIFFAGHGLVEGERDGYLLLHDSDPNNLYSTALQLSELDHIITERVKARNVILITDACHAGQLGWASRSTKESAALVNRYLTEVGKSGKGVFRLLASRADELSYEDKRWGGGHGAFTFHLLEGLQGKADRDADGVVRSTEILEYLSDAVPRATQALQHPQGAGLVDSKLPLSITKTLLDKTLAAAEKPAPMKPTVEKPSAVKPVVKARLVKLEVRGAVGSSVYVDNALRGKIGRNGALIVEKLPTGKHEIVVQTPGGEKSKQELDLDKDGFVLDVNKTARTIERTPSLADQIKQALAAGNTGDALKFYEQLLRTQPNDAERPRIEIALSLTVETLAQKVVNDYLHASLLQFERASFRQGAEAYKWLKLIHAGQMNAQQEANYLFCEGRALLEENRAKDALVYLEKATTLDAKAAHLWNAVGLAYDKQGIVERAVEAYKQALQLAPTSAEPHFYLGALFLRIGQPKQAEQPLLQAAKFAPNSVEPRAQLVRLWRVQKQWKKAEAEADGIMPALETNAVLGAEVWFDLAQVYEATKRGAKAAEAYEKVVQLTPQRADREPLLEKAKKLRGTVK